jgi:6-phosphogluconolactonase
VSDTVSAYAIEAATGALNPIAGPVAAGDAPTAISAEPSGRFVYVANAASDNISAYAIDALSGALTAIAGSPFVATNPPLSAPFSISVEPGGRSVYVASNASNFVSTFRIDAITGALTEIGSAATGANTRPTAVEPDPTGRFAYVASHDTNEVIAYPIDTQGPLSPTPIPGSPFAAGTNPLSLGTDPSGRFLYATNHNSSNVTAFAINGSFDMSRGELDVIVGSPFATGMRPVAFSTEPRGRFAYVANEGSRDVSAYSIDATTGALSAVAGGSIAAGTRPSFVRADPSGKFVYVTDYDSNAVAAFAIDPTTGALTAIAGSPFATGGTGAISVAVTGSTE